VNKTEIEYIKGRVGEVVLCVNGDINTKLNKKKHKVWLNDAEKIKQIRKGEATLLPDVELAKKKGGYDYGVEVLDKFFSYKTTPAQKKLKRENDRIQSKIDDLCLQVEAAGRKIVDRVVLGIIAKQDLPGELEQLGNMIKLAK